jgi:hypothetical protein
MFGTTSGYAHMHPRVLIPEVFCFHEVHVQHIEQLGTAR